MALTMEMKGIFKKKPKAGAPPDAAGEPEAQAQAKTRPGAGAGPATVKPGTADYIAGEAKLARVNLTPYLPHDLVGGSIPHVPGSEIEAVWNAACQACGTERVHYCFTVQEGRCWYLACPSASLASNPDSWCPLAAALPGNSEYWDKETVYLYEQEGMASALRWDPETSRLQVFLGAARTLLPRIQSMDANFVTVNAEMATVVPWRNRALRTEKLSRATAFALLYAGLLINVAAIVILIVQYVFANFVSRDLESVREATEQASMSLMTNASNALQSDAIRHMVRIQELLDSLQKIDGTLVKYEIEKGKVKWEALVPPTFSNCEGALKGCKVTEGLEKDGRVRISGSK